MTDRDLGDIPQPVTLEAFLRVAWLRKYTGPITVHFAQGHANAVEIPAPALKVKIDKGSATA